MSTPNRILDSARRGLLTAQELREGQLTSTLGQGGGPGGRKPPIKEKSSVPIGVTLRKLTGYIRPVVPAMGIALICAVVGVILTILAPGYLSDITDEISAGLTGEINMGEVYRLMWISIAFLAGSLVLSIIEGIIMARSTVWVSRTMRTDLDRKIDRLPLHYLDKTSTGDTLSRVTNDVDTLQQTLNNSLATTITGIVTLAGSAVMMFVTDWRMALAAIVASFLGIAGSGLILGASQKYFVAQQALLGKLNGHIEETLSGHGVIRVYNGEADARREFEERNSALYSVAWKSMFFSGLMFPLMTFIGNLGYVAVCLVGAALVLDGTISFGVIVAFIVYVRLFTNPLGQLAQAATSLQSAAAAGARIFEFLEADELVDESAKVTPLPASVEGRVDFEDVRFSYEPGQEIIHGFSGSVLPGQKVALVGPTGAGKTTLVNLLMRFYELDSGQIRLDGVPLASYTREQVDSLFGMVLQDTWLFEGTLRENLVYGASGVTEDRLNQVVESVGLAELVARLPHGLETVLDDSAQLSAGQKQLVTIARAMVADKPLLILDEATSSVDTRTEVLIQRALAQLADGRTSFVIAHRLSTIRDADLIFAIRDGDIVESGSHDELLARGGFYADLYNAQFTED